MAKDDIISVHFNKVSYDTIWFEKQLSHLLILSTITLYLTHFEHNHIILNWVSQKKKNNLHMNVEI